MRWRCLLLGGWLLIVWCPLAWAEDHRTKAEVLAELGGDPRLQHELWTRCHAVGLFVDYKPAKHSSVPYPPEERMQAVIRSKLRAARLYRNGGSGVNLVVSIRAMRDEPDGPLNELALISFRFLKEMYDPWTKTYRSTWAWIIEDSAGVSRLYETVSAQMDYFLDEYLRVNEPACKTVN